jgi:hypothetical protein
MAIQSNFPAIKPTLLLDFANTEQLDPRITFTRASTGTFYGTQTAKAEENLLLQSQDYSTSWTVTSLTPVTGKTAPDATSTATEFTASAANAVLTQGYTAIAGSYTFSVFLRRVTGSGDIQIAADNGTWTTKVITGTWARYDVTQTVAAGSKTAGVRVVTDTDAIEVWGAQLEQRSAVTAYTATTTQPITNYISVLQTAASGVARFDHNPITDESLGLLIEEQRTNLLTYSEQFNDAAWAKGNASITANAIVAPDGTLTGDKFIPNSGETGGAGTVVQTLSKSATATTYTLTGYAKAGEFSSVRLYLNQQGNTGNRCEATYNVSTGATSSITNVGTFTGASASMVLVGNGWYRCVLTATTSTETGIQFRFANAVSGQNGNGFSGIFIWGAQLEAGAFPTSYIQTVASQVTRAADAASMTGANFSSWYNQAEGTFFAHAGSTLTGTTRRIYSASAGSFANSISLSFSTTSNAAAQIWVGAAIQANIGINVSSSVTNVLHAFAYKTNDIAATANAASATTDTSAILPVTNQFGIGSEASATFLNGHIRKLSYYPLRVTDAQLQALTS